jgi:hypothetical protein
MGRLRSGLWLAAAIVSLAGISGCGGNKPGGASPFPARVTLSPGNSTSVQAGAVFSFTATAQNGSGGTVGVTFIFSSNDTSVLNLAPNGVACAGHWDAAYTTCSPGATGVAEVTAEALGATSPPTFVFVHPPVDNITVSGVLLDGLPIQEPCLSQGQSMTVEAHAFSQGSDVTASVGPFTWSANNTNVVKLTPLVNPAYTFPTNRATATAVTPGITQIFATAGSVSSNTFQQPQYTNAQGATSPLLDFFETCPIQNITLELGAAGSQTGQTSFATTKGTPQTVTAVETDVMGNNSLPDPNALVVLSKIPLTWSASTPSVVAVPSTCQESCSLTTPSPGAGSVTASCSPPTCNIGFPEIPATLSSAACADFFGSCQQFIPLPVYATTAISGVVTGAPVGSSVLATSTGCANVNPLDCATSIYNISTSKSVAGVPTQLPDSPNSLLYDLAGDKAYMGSQIGAVAVTPASLGTTSNPFASLGTVTGNVLAISNNGGFAVFSDTQLSPNQAFVVNASNSNSPAVTAFKIAGASTAAFAPDGLKGYIFGSDAGGNPNLYVYSTLQALQTIPLPANTTVNAITFSTNSAFAYVVEPSRAGGGPAFTVLNTCDNQISTDLPNGGSPQIISLSAPPVVFKALPDGVHFVALENNGTFDYITATIAGIPAATPTKPATSICPMTVSHSVQNINLGQGTIHPLDVFASADGTLLYVVASDRSSILVYNFATSSVSGIELAGNAAPLTAAMTSDAGTILVAASDGLLHEVSTALGGNDLVQVSFPNLPNFLNPFCTGPGPNGPCTLNLLAVKP